MFAFCAAASSYTHLIAMFLSSAQYGKLLVFFFAERITNIYIYTYICIYIPSASLSTRFLCM